MKKEKRKLLGVDLDGTLAKEMKPYDPLKVGPPVPKMLLKVRRKLKQGEKVWILTARVNSLTHSYGHRMKVKKIIERWCLRWLGQKLFVTSEKHPEMYQIWDDRVRQVRANKGTFVVEEIIHAVRSARR